MADRPTALERAFTLAKSGAVSSVVDIRRALKREGLDEKQIEGRQLRAQLRAMIEKAHT